MNEIKIYIDNIFSAYKDTEEIQSLKKEMTENMELKYQDFLREGADSDQALGRVIRDFGSLEDLDMELADYKLSSKKKLSKKKVEALKTFAWMITISIYIYTGMVYGLWFINWILFLIMSGLDNIIDAYF